MYFFPRFVGNEGPTGIAGPVGPSGPKGERGAEGQALSGVTYNRWGRTNCSGDASVVYTGMRITRTQLFRERLSEKVHATIPKSIVGFWVHCSSKNFEILAREVMDICLGVLKESNKVGSTATTPEKMYWSYPILPTIPFGIVASTFSDNLSRKRKIRKRRIPRRRRQWESQKNNYSVKVVKELLCTFMSLFWTLLCRHCETATYVLWRNFLSVS